MLDESELLHREALAARRETLGSRHVHTLISMNNLAGLLLAMGKFTEVEPLHREAYEGSCSTLGKSHPTTQEFLSSLWQLGLEP